MAEPARRKRFQIHLSTAVVMMIAAGAIIWANVQKELIATLSDPYYVCGWPNRAVFLPPDGWVILPRGMIVNVVIAINIMGATWFVCEWLIRWRAARKGA